MAGFSVPLAQVIYNGVPAVAAKINVYQAGTTTPVTVYADASLSTPTTNPVVCDSNGEAVFYVASSVALRLYVTTSGGTLIHDIPVVYPVPDMSGFTGSGVDLNKIAGITNGTAANSKAMVLDSSGRISGLYTEAANTSSTYLANMAAVQQSMTGGFLNKFRNGTFDIWQRGTAGTAASGSPVYTADGWIVGATGATAAWARILNASTGTYYELGISGNTSMSDTYLRQRIEAAVAMPLANTNVTVQFVVFNQTGGSITPTITVKHPNSVNNFSALTTVVNATNLQSVANNAVATVAYTFSNPSAASTGLEVTLGFGSALNANTKTVYILAADIRATPGVSTGLNGSPPVRELRPVAMELAFCQRYFCTSFPNGTAPTTAGGNNDSLACVSQASAAFGGSFGFPVAMAYAPTVTTYNPASANANWRDITAAADRTATVSNVGVNNFTITGAGGAANSVNCIHYSATAEY